MSIFKKTRLDRNVFVEPPVATTEVEAAYPHIEEEEVTPLAPPVVAAPPKVVEAQASPVPTRGEASKTVNPYIKAAAKPQQTKVVLTPISKDDEVAFEPLVFEQEAILLNRATIDSANPTISAKGHALIEVKNGKVYLSNQTTAETTFLQVKTPVALQSGDVILLGDRLVRIDVENVAALTPGLDD